MSAFLKSEHFLVPQKALWCTECFWKAVSLSCLGLHSQFVKGQELSLHLLSLGLVFWAQIHPSLSVNRVYHCTVLEVEQYLQTIVYLICIWMHTSSKTVWMHVAYAWVAHSAPYTLARQDRFARISRHVAYGICMHLHLEFCLSRPFTTAYLKALKNVTCL